MIGGSGRAHKMRHRRYGGKMARGDDVLILDDFSRDDLISLVGTP
jgi:hypothetical protein